MESIGAGGSSNHVESAPVGGVDSGSSHEISSFTRIDREFYKAAVEGNFNKFINVPNIESLLTPNKNTILHLHLTSTTTQRVSKPQLIRRIQGKFLDLSHIEPTISKHFVEQILEKCGMLALLPNAKGETPLHLAARYGHYTIIELLKEHYLRSSALGRADENNDTALHEAVRGNHVEVVEILLEMDSDLANIANKAKETPLYVASQRQYTKIVRKILEKVELPAYEGPNGRTALHAAVINRDLGMTRDLLENEHLRGAIKHQDKEHWVPLHYAVEAGNEFLTKFLLENDDANTAYMQDSKGRTPLHIAAHCDHWIIFEMIIKYYPDCSELVDNKGWNALHYAVNKECYKTLGRIVLNPSLSNLYNEKDRDGNTPLHLLTNSRMRTNKLVSHHRVDKLALNKKDQTALDIAYTTLEDSDRPLTKQTLIGHMERFGAKRSQLLHGKSNDKSSLEFTKEAKESHLIVATLIATVTFAAAFTLPGGTIQDGDLKGSPIMGHKPSFKAFIVSNTIALVMSASAALIHLFSPLNKAKRLDHYFSEVAFSFILVAVASMIVAFEAGMYVVLGSSSIGIAVISVGFVFYLIFRQVLRMSFRFNSLLAFLLNLLNVIMFPFIRSKKFGFFFLLFKRSNQDEEIKEASSIV